MTNEEFQTLVLQQFARIETRMDRFEESQARLENHLDRLENRIDKLETRMGRLENRIDKLETRMGRLETHMGKLEKSQDILASEVMSIKTDVQKVTSTVIRIEQSHGAQLGALMDGQRQNTEILDRHTEQLDRIEGKIESHDIQISILDKTKANWR